MTLQKSGNPSFTARNCTLSQAQWEYLKPIVKQEYVVNKRTTDDIRQLLAPLCGFVLTTKQLRPKIKLWGFEKHTKRPERQGIIALAIEGESVTIDGHTYDWATISRWKRQEKKWAAEQTPSCHTTRHSRGTSGHRHELPDVQSFDSDQVDCGSQSGSIYHEDILQPSSTSSSWDVPPGYAPTQEQDEAHSTGTPNTLASTDSMEIECLQGVDVTDSTGLASLVGALAILVPDEDLSSLNLLSDIDDEIACCDDDCSLRAPIYGSSGLNTERPWARKMPSTLLSTPPQHPRPKVYTSMYDRVLSRWSHTDLSKELWPFPTNIRPNNGSMITRYTPPLSCVVLSEFDCKSRFARARKRRIIDPVLLRSMWIIAERYEEEERLAVAQYWYQAIVAHITHNSQQIRKPDRPREVLKASIAVIRSMRYQSKFLEARKLHEPLHRCTMQRGTDEDLVIESKRLSAALCGSFGKFEDEENLRRHILQIFLTSHGVRNQGAMDALSWLGRCLRQRDKGAVSEHILRSTLQLKLEAMGLTDFGLGEIKSLLQCMVNLARTLIETGNTEEARGLLEAARAKLLLMPDSVGVAIEWDIGYELVNIVCKRKMWKESATQLKGLVSRLANKGLDIKRHGDAMTLLAYIMTKLGRFDDAVKYDEQSFADYSIAYGLKHRATMRSVMKIGYSLADQKKIGHAMLHFWVVLRRLEDLVDDDDFESTQHWRSKIHLWMSEIQRPAKS